MSNGAILIMQERVQQIIKWGADHDSDHTDQELLYAAAAYLLHGYYWIEENGVVVKEAGDIFWPFPEPFKPGAHIRNLVKAGALIAAEIDRLTADADKE